MNPEPAGECTYRRPKPRQFLQAANARPHGWRPGCWPRSHPDALRRPLRHRL